MLTYSRRNVSVGRVIGIHRGRVMGGREHSVVVDSDSWTTDSGERKQERFTPMWTHNRGHGERRTTRGTWSAGMRQTDAELSASCPSGSTHQFKSIPDPPATYKTHVHPNKVVLNS